MAPADAGDVGTAPFWYYVDNSGAQQGPFAVAHMYSWHAAGYLLPTTKMAASYYGEVPDAFWPLAELFEASEQPFANGAAAPAPAESDAGGSAAPAPARPAQQRPARVGPRGRRRRRRRPARCRRISSTNSPGRRLTSGRTARRRAGAVAARVAAAAAARARAVAPTPTARCATPSSHTSDGNQLHRRRPRLQRAAQAQCDGTKVKMHLRSILRKARQHLPLGAALPTPRPSRRRAGAGARAPTV